LLALSPESSTNSTVQAPPLTFAGAFSVVTPRDDDLHSRPGRICHGNRGARRSKTSIGEVMRGAKRATAITLAATAVALSVARRLVAAGGQRELATQLAESLDPACVFWTAFDNAPWSKVAGILRKRRGCRSGVSDLLVLHKGKLIGLEVKSHSGRISTAQKEVRLEMLRAGGIWWMARTHGRRWWHCIGAESGSGGGGALPCFNPGRSRWPTLLSHDLAP